MDELVDLNFYEQATLGIDIDQLIETARNYKDRDIRYFTKYTFMPFKNPDTLYLMFLSYNSSFNNRKQIVFEDHSSIFYG